MLGNSELLRKVESYVDIKIAGEIFESKSIAINLVCCQRSSPNFPSNNQANLSELIKYYLIANFGGNPSVKDI